MKNIQHIFFMIVIFVAISSCNNPPMEEAKEVDKTVKKELKCPTKDSSWVLPNGTKCSTHCISIYKEGGFKDVSGFYYSRYDTVMMGTGRAIVYKEWTEPVTTSKILITEVQDMKNGKRIASYDGSSFHGF